MKTMKRVLPYVGMVLFTVIVITGGIWVNQLIITSVKEAGFNEGVAYADSPPGTETRLATDEDRGWIWDVEWPCECPGDLNCDGHVNAQDLSAIVHFWGEGCVD